MSTSSGITWDADKLRGVILNAKTYNLDFGRASFTLSDKGGYLVKIDAPLFPLNHEMYPHGAQSIHANSASVAEGEMLYALFSMTKAERLTARSGGRHCAGWDKYQITHTPLSEAEIAEHRERIKHSAKVGRYRRELDEVIARSKRVETATAGVTHLNETYGVTVPVAAMPASTANKTPQAPNAQHRRGNRK